MNFAIKLFVFFRLFSQCKELRGTANMFVVNLAFSDFCMMLTQFPMFVWNSFNGGQWLFGPAACALYACTGSIFGNCSIMTLACVSYDRYNVIVRGMSGTPMTSSKKTTCINIKRFGCNINWLMENRKGDSYDHLLLVLGDLLVSDALLWLRSLHPRGNFGLVLFWLPHPGWFGIVHQFKSSARKHLFIIWNKQTRIFGCCLFFFLYCCPLSVILFCYFHIVNAIFSHEKTLRDQAKKMNVTSLRSNVDANATSAEMRIAKVAMVNIGLWVSMWTPYAAIVLQVYKSVFHNKREI